MKAFASDEKTVALMEQYRKMGYLPLKGYDLYMVHPLKQEVVCFRRNKPKTVRVLDYKRQVHLTNQNGGRYVNLFKLMYAVQEGIDLSLITGNGIGCSAVFNGDRYELVNTSSTIESIRNNIREHKKCRRKPKDILAKEIDSNIRFLKMQLDCLETGDYTPIAEACKSQEKDVKDFIRICHGFTNEDSKNEIWEEVLGTAFRKVSTGEMIISDIKGYMIRISAKLCARIRKERKRLKSEAIDQAYGAMTLTDERATCEW